MANKTLLGGDPDLGRPEKRDAGGPREFIGALFPQVPFREGASSRDASAARLARAAANVACQVAIVGIGAVLLLFRLPGVSAWESGYAEDWSIFLPSALKYPWHLFIPYMGYEQLGPRLIAQLVTSLPIMDAAAGFAIAGALIASASALFIFHASEGFVESRWLRAVPGMALLLLSIAPIEVIDSGVDTPWYALTAAFFAVLWRPKGWPGMAAAALITFYACSSEIVACVVLAPLVMVRLAALPRWREHAVTAGWLAGVLIQVLVVMKSYTMHVQRFKGTLVPLDQTTPIYSHDVVLPSLGWHLAQWLIRIAGANGATVIVAGLLAIMTGWAVITGSRRTRLFVAAALIIGFAETIFTATLNSSLGLAVTSQAITLVGSRYSILPVVLIQAVGVVAVDGMLSRRSGRHALPARQSSGRGVLARGRLGALIATAALVGLLGSGWVADYRYSALRSQTGVYWPPYARAWVDACARNPGGEFSMAARGPNYYVRIWRLKIECSRLRG